MAVIRTVVLAVFMAAAGLADIWIEAGDAGRELATANVTVGAVLDSIFGSLSAPDPLDAAFDVDLYLINISDPLNFSASTVNAPGFYVSDPQLFLFSSAGLGVYMNDDDESGLNGSQSALPAGHPFGPVTAGLYYLGIGWFNNEPFSAGGPIFSSASPIGTNGPDVGLGGTDPLLGWDDNVLQRIDLETAYEIHLTGAVAAVPEPATIAMVATVFAAFLVMLRRTRLPSHRRYTAGRR
jgi:hypothetical protein